MRKTILHIFFWIFIFLYIFDYVVELFPLSKSLYLTTFEVILFSIEFYLHLYFLFPVIYQNKGVFQYLISLFLLLFLTWLTYFLFGIEDELLSENFIRGIVTFLLNHLLFIFISYVVWYFMKYFTEKEKNLKLENDKLQMEMLLLKTQISPHFLFNALNNIYSLTLMKSDDAPKMLSALSDILRYLLYEGNKKSVFLTAEIDTIYKYIDIQKYRKIPGLNNISIQVHGDLSAIQIPPLIFMTLIENSFKHGDIVENNKGFVTIVFEIQGSKIDFKIENSYSTREVSNGVGLKNIHSQLNILYGNNYQLKIDESNSIFHVNLQIDGY